MATCIAFIIGLFAGGTVCLFGIAAAAVDERYEAYQNGYTAGYSDAKEE